MSQPSPHQFCRRTRRDFLWQSGAGFMGTALAGMLGSDFFTQQTLAADGKSKFTRPLAVKPPHFAPKAKSVIFLYMYGGPSHMDTFDYKPDDVRPRQPRPWTVKTFGRGGHRNQGRLGRASLEVQAVRRMRQVGQRPVPASLATRVDDIAFMHSMTADSPIHGSAMLMMNSGRVFSGSPCLGQVLVNYGLGSVNREPARLRRHARPARRPDQRREELVQRLHARQSTRATVMRSKGDRRSLNLEPASWA